MNKRVIFLGISFITALVVLTLCSVLLYYTPEGTVYPLDSGWTAELNGQELANDVTLKELSDNRLLHLKKGDILSLTSSLPDTTGISFPAVQLKTQYCAYRVIMDNDEEDPEQQILAEGGFKETVSDDFLGCSYHFISLPQGSSGRKLTIELTAADDDPFTEIETPLLGSHHDLEYGFLHKNMFPICAGIFLAVFGGAFLFITLLFFLSTPGILVQLFSSILYMVLGIWLLCHYNTAFLFMNGAYMTVFEYATLYLVIPLCLLILLFIGEHRRFKPFLVFACICSVLSVLFIFLHFTGIIYMNHTYGLYRVLGSLAYAALILMYLRDRKLGGLSRSDMLQMLGLFLFSSLIILDMILSLLGFEDIALTRYALPASALVYTFTQLVNYFTFISESYARNHEYETLTRMAYEDSLTDLANRSRSERYMAALSESRFDYCVISLDLNGLKTVNDRHGHTMGDKYLREFSQAFRTSFDENAFLSRLGGDEFMVILKSTTPEEVDSSLDKLTTALDVMNALYPDYHRSVAAGYAFRHEAEENSRKDRETGEEIIKTRDKRTDIAHVVYALADSRMYENKRKLHAKYGLGEIR